MARSFYYVPVPDREPKFPDGALFMPIKSDRISLVKRKDKANRFASVSSIHKETSYDKGDVRCVGAADTQSQS